MQPAFRGRARQELRSTAEDYASQSFEIGLKERRYRRHAAKPVHENLAPSQ